MPTHRQNENIKSINSISSINDNNELYKKKKQQDLLKRFINSSKTIMPIVIFILLYQELQKHCNIDNITPDCNNCKIKNAIIRNLEAIINKYKTQDIVKNEDIETNYLNSLKLLQKELEEKDLKIKYYGGMLKALDFYNKFNTQQSQFMKYITEMRQAEDENNDLKKKIRILNKINNDYVSKKKKSLANIVPTKKECNESREEAISNQLTTAFKSISKAIIKIEEVICSESFFESLSEYKTPIIPYEVLLPFEDNNDLDDNNPNYSQNSSENNNLERRAEVKKLINKFHNKVNEGMNVIINYLRNISYC